jgi:phosphatidylglycerol---prolipoprotein diacylglyceryl transferase
MFVLDPNPIAFEFLIFQVRWYGLFAALSALAGYYIAPYLARKRFNDKRYHIYQNAILIGAISGIIGARIVHVMLAWNHYSDNIWRALAVWEGGLAFHGGLLFAVIALWVYSRSVKVPFAQITDVVVIPLALALSIGRIGNIMNSEIRGRPCDSCLFSFTFADDGIERYPVQAYSMIKNAVVAAISYALLINTKTAGFSSAAFLFFYSIFRFVVEFYRMEPYFFLNLSLAQIVMIPIIIGSGYWLFRLISVETNS